MKKFYFNGLDQAAYILERIQPYIKKSKEEWKIYIKSVFIRNFKQDPNMDWIFVAGFTCLITDTMEDGTPIVDVLIQPVMMQQYLKNNRRALPYNYADIDYMEIVEMES